MGKIATLRRLGGVVLAILLGCSGRAQTFVATYTFASAASDTPTQTGLAFTSLSGANVTLQYSSPNTNTFTTAWVTGGASPNTSEYLSLSLQATSGYALDLSSLTFNSSRSASGPPNVRIEMFIDGTSVATSSDFTIADPGSGTTASMSSSTFNFADQLSIAAATVVEFRFYAWGGTSSSGSLRLDDIAISGALAAVPEPATWGLIAGLVAFLAARHRRKIALWSH